MFLMPEHHIIIRITPLHELPIAQARIACAIKQLRETIRRHLSEGMGHGPHPPDNSWPLEDTNDLWLDGRPEPSNSHTDEMNADRPATGAKARALAPCSRGMSE